MGLNAYGGYAMNLANGLRGGLTAHFIYDNIQQAMPGQTVALDGGLFYRVPGTPLSLSAVLSEIGWNLDDASLPMEFKTALAYQINFDRALDSNRFQAENYITLSAEDDWSLIDPVESSFGFGAEAWYKGLIALRGGYRFADYSNIAGLTGFSLGAGIRYMGWQLDYAMTTLGDFGTSNQISLSFMFGESKKAPARISPPVVKHSQVASPVLNGVIPSPSSGNGNPGMLNLYQAGMAAFQAKDYEKSLDYLKKAVVCPGGKVWQYAEGYAMLGVINEFHSNAKDHLATANHYYRIALWLDPQNATAKKHLK
jgi:tetratricopeptide (TPR) repeat protein